jgi:hypothetical protein
MATLRLSTTVEDLLRLAWWAERSGRPNLRDALMTLAVAESGPEEAVLAERCRRLLVARQPDHWYATTATLGLALGHERVAAVIERLRAMFPPVRVERLLMKAAAEAGPYEPPAPLRRVFEDLGLIPVRGGRAQAPTLRFPGPWGDDDAADADRHARELAAFSLTILLAMAVLIRAVQDAGHAEDGPGIRAA